MKQKSDEPFYDYNRLLRIISNAAPSQKHDTETNIITLVAFLSFTAGLMFGIVIGGLL